MGQTSAPGSGFARPASAGFASSTTPPSQLPPHPLQGIQNLFVQILQDVEDAQLVAGLGPQFGQQRRIELRAVGHNDLRLHAPVLEVLEEPPQVVVVVAANQCEGHGKVLERVRGQQQGIAAQVKFIDAERAAEAVQDPTAMVRQVKLPDPLVEAVVDEAVGEVQEKVPVHGTEDLLDAHAILQDVVEDGLADLVIVQRLGLDTRRRGTEGGTAIAPGSILAVGDVEVDDLLVGDRANLTV